MPKPVVALIGSEYEENLSLRYLASAVEAQGFTAALVAFNEPADRDSVMATVLAKEPLAVGISVPFQHRALGAAAPSPPACASSAMAATSAWAAISRPSSRSSILRDLPAIDSVVRHEGEETLSRALRRLRDGRALAAIQGLVVREGSRTHIGPARLLPHLDELPFPDRRGKPHDVLGVSRPPPSWAAVAATPTAPSAASSRMRRTRRARATACARPRTSSGR